MLFVLNKEKICAYVISILTVITLFCVTQVLQNEVENTTPTSVNIYTNNAINNINHLD